MLTEWVYITVWYIRSVFSNYIYQIAIKFSFWKIPEIHYTNIRLQQDTKQFFNENSFFRPRFEILVTSQIEPEEPYALLHIRHICFIKNLSKGTLNGPSRLIIDWWIHSFELFWTPIQSGFTNKSSIQEGKANDNGRSTCWQCENWKAWRLTTRDHKSIHISWTGPYLYLRVGIACQFLVILFKHTKLYSYK